MILHACQNSSQTNSGAEQILSFSPWDTYPQACKVDDFGGQFDAGAWTVDENGVIVDEVIEFVLHVDVSLVQPVSGIEQLIDFVEAWVGSNLLDRVVD